MEIYKGMAGSPITYLASNISAGQTTISVADDTALPDAPNICTIGYGEEIETIRYGTKSNGVLQNVTRGIEGAPRAWQVGTEVARFFTAYDHDAIAEVLSKNPVWFSEFEEALINSVSTKIFKNLFGNGSKIHASEIAFESGLLLPEVPEIIENSNGTAFKFPSGLLIFYSDEFTLTYNSGNLLQASHDTPIAFRDGDYFIKPQINIPASNKRVGLYQDIAVASPTRYSIRLISSSASNFTAGDTVKAKVFGIGRWK